MVQICALASGSNGNCYYIGNNNEAVLIDIGISNKQLNDRMKLAGLDINKVKAVFISHEHTDHIKGMRVATSKNNLKAYITRKTYAKSKLDYRSDKACFFNAGDTITVDNIKVHTFNKHHDAVDPVSFRVEIDGLNIAVLTDVGEACEHVREHLTKCNAAFLETNYEPDILFEGSYPYFLKNRVASSKGHLSNKQAISLIKELNSPILKTLILSHISADNNSQKVLSENFKDLELSHNIEYASRIKASKVIEL